MKSETGIESYRNEQSITNIRQETETDLRKISQMKIQQTNLKMSLDAVQELYEYIKSGKNDFLTLAPNFEAFTDLLSTEMVKNIKRLQAEKRDLLLTYTTNDEKAKVIDEKIKDLTDYLAESIHNTLTNQQVKLKILNADIEEAEQVFASVPEKERLLNDMNRDFELLQSSYNFLNEKKIEAEIAQSARIAFHRVITPGEAPIKPVSPVRSIIIIFSGLLGLIGSVTLIYLIHFAKGKVNDIATLEKNSDIPVALCTPKLNTRLETENHFLKEAIQLELKGILKQGVKLAITSYDNTEDHLFHTLQLTTALVAQGRKVLLVDATGTYATTNLPASQVTYLNVSLPHYKTLSRANMLSEIEKAQTGSDVCVIYNQAIAHESIALLLMSIADANLFVMDSRKTAAKKITLITQLSSEFSLPNMWFVLNKAGYNPNVVTQSLRRIKRFYHKIKYARA
jgi:capsular polysaccharide biosynthesis protein